MARLISFALTKDQIRNRTKTVTRRVRWLKLKPFTHLDGVEKAMGFKPGTTGNIRWLDSIYTLSVLREPLQALIDDPDYGRAEAIKEGFPHLDGAGFVKMFCDDLKSKPNAVLTRIEFCYPLTIAERNEWLKTKGM